MKTAKLIVVLVILAVLAGGSYYMFGSYSDGNRAGTVIKRSRKGLLFKTYEGELNLGLVLGDQKRRLGLEHLGILRSRLEPRSTRQAGHRDG